MSSKHLAIVSAYVDVLVFIVHTFVGDTVGGAGKKGGGGGIVAAVGSQ
jgi:hypothetical protein